MKRRFLLGGLLILFVLTAFTEVQARTFYIGASLPLSGEFAQEGQNMLKALQLYARQVNATNELPGNTIEILAHDDQNKPEIARTVAERLVGTPDLLGIVGPYYTSTLTGSGAMAIYDKARVPMMAPFECGTAAEDGSSYEFNMNYSNAHQARFMADYLKEVLKKDNILLIYNNDLFGATSGAAFEKRAREIGLNVQKTLGYDHVKKFGPDFISVGVGANEIASFGAAVLFSRVGSAVKLVKQLRTARFEGLIFGPHTFASRAMFTDLTEEESDQIHIASPFIFELANFKAMQFAEDFRKAYGEEPSVLAPICYDSAFLLGQALQAVGSDRAAIRNYLASMTWQTAGEGLSGNLFFEKSGAMDRDVFVCKVEKGRFKVTASQLLEPHEPYVIKQLPDRIKKGQMIEVAGIPYHLVDVVFVGLDLIRIIDVDPKTNAFEAEIFLWYKWTNEKLDIGTIDILNVAAKKENNLWKEDLTRPTKYRCNRIKALFQMPYDLSRFPFDYQALPISIAPRNKNATHIMLALDNRHMEFNPVKDIPQEWTFLNRTAYSGLYRYESTFGDPDYRLTKGYKSKVYFSTVSISLGVRRNIFPYLFSLFLPMGIILLIGSLVFFLPVDQFVVRINMTMSGLLAFLVFYMAQKGTLPRVGYLMKSDYYFIVGFLLMLILMGLNIAIVYFHVKRQDKETAAWLNGWVTTLFLPLFFLSLVAITVWA